MREKAAQNWNTSLLKNTLIEVTTKFILPVLISVYTCLSNIAHDHRMTLNIEYE